MDRFTTPQKIGVGGALLLLIASFLPWYSVSGFSINAWDAEFLAWGGVVLGVAAGVVMLLKALGKQDVQAGGLASEQIALALAAGSFLLIVLRLLTESSFSAFGLYLGIVAAGVTAYGCFLEMKARGMSVNDMKDRLSGGSSAGTGAPPTSP
jgi:hypothetical protein